MTIFLLLLFLTIFIFGKPSKKLKRDPLSVMVVTGQVGDGKGLCSVGRIHEYLSQGLSVATNMDIYPEHLPISPYRKDNWRLIRLPDYPTVEDLNNLGKGYQGDFQPGREGLIVLDECSSFLNARSWNSKDRKAVIEWFVHVRKYRWNLLLQIQDETGLDSQLSKFVIKFVGRCYVNEEFPFIKHLPRFHFISINRLVGNGRIRYQRKSYSAKAFYNSYDTEQSFSFDSQIGLHSVLSPWHLKGRYLPPKMTIQQFIITTYLYSFCRIEGFITGKNWRDVAAKYRLLKTVKNSSLDDKTEYPLLTTTIAR